MVNQLDGLGARSRVTLVEGGTSAAGAAIQKLFPAPARSRRTTLELERVPDRNPLTVFHDEGGEAFLPANFSEARANGVPHWSGYVRSVAGDADASWRHLYVVGFEVPREDFEDFDEWYEVEHVPLLLRVPGWIHATRVSVDLSAPVLTHLALHRLRDLRVLEAPEREAARSTPWRQRFAAQSWFERSMRCLGERVGVPDDDRPAS